jgi:hypothetical protein
MYTYVQILCDVWKLFCDLTSLILLIYGGIVSGRMRLKKQKLFFCCERETKRYPRM